MLHVIPFLIWFWCQLTLPLRLVNRKPTPSARVCQESVFLPCIDISVFLKATEFSHTTFLRRTRELVGYKIYCESSMLLLPFVLPQCLRQTPTLRQLGPPLRPLLLHMASSFPISGRYATFQWIITRVERQWQLRLRGGSKKFPSRKLHQLLYEQCWHASRENWQPSYTTILLWISPEHNLPQIFCCFSS